MDKKDCKGDEPGKGERIPGSLFGVHVFLNKEGDYCFKYFFGVVPLYFLKTFMK